MISSFPSLVPPFSPPYPGPDSLVPGAWPRQFVPGGATKEMEKGGSKGACRDLLQNHSCSLSSEKGYVSERVRWREMLTLWVTNWVFMCADRELDGSPVMVWRPESHNKAGEFTQRTKRGREGGWQTESLVSRLGLPATGRKELLDDLQTHLAWR